MAIITDFSTWCERYGYDPESPEAERDYREARENLAVLQGAWGGTPSPEAEAGGDDEVALYHSMLRVEALGAACLELTHKLQDEIQDGGGPPRDYPSLGRLMMIAELIKNTAGAATDP